MLSLQAPGGLSSPGHPEPLPPASALPARLPPARGVSAPPPGASLLLFLQAGGWYAPRLPFQPVLGRRLGFPGWPQCRHTQVTVGSHLLSQQASPSFLGAHGDMMREGDGLVPGWHRSLCSAPAVRALIGSGGLYWCLHKGRVALPAPPGALGAFRLWQWGPRGQGSGCWLVITVLPEVSS